MKKVKILLVAIGGYGATYIRELTEKGIKNAVVEGVCEVMPGAREQFPVIGEQNIPLYHTLEEFYNQHEADLAVISTPMHLHYEQTKFCLEHGSNVLLEKPVCTNLEDAKALIELEKKTGRFVAIGYQQNYQLDVLTLKQDILDGIYGQPVLMKTMQALQRGENYYHRNNWAGRIMVGGHAVNDSPFNNASAHQFQVMTFLLGDQMDTAAAIKMVTGELYRANCHVENYDTAAVCAYTKAGTPIYFYTTHNIAERQLGPIAEFRFELGTVYFGKDFGDGPVSEFVAVMNDGTIRSYAGIPKGRQLQKLYDAIDCTLNGGQPVCTVQCAIPHLEAVLELAKLPIQQIREEELEFVEENGGYYCRIRNVEEIYTQCYANQQMPSEFGAGWIVKEGEG